MSVKQVTTEQTEAELEAQIRSTIQLAFPWLPANSIKHQTKFRVQIGRKPIEVDGKVETVEARADILLYSGGRCIAVLELKRPGADLSLNDDAQGLSYAKLLTPPPPLVVVTNGTDVHFIETHTGKAWKPEQPSETALQGLIDSAARVAKADLKEAIETLMGTSPAVWMPAIREETRAKLETMSGSWDDPMRPFVKGWLLPRIATVQVLQHVEAGQKLTLLVGPPLAGKSNVLREICEQTEGNEAVAALYLESGSAGGIYQAIADVLGSALAWPVSTGEARQWLARVSKSTQHKLLVLIDGLDPLDRDARRELEDLISRTFGSGLLVVVAMHEDAAEKLCSSKSLVSASPIGRTAVRVELGPLRDKEFEAAAMVLEQRRVHFFRGADSAAEMRQPWVLRTITSSALEMLENAKPGSIGMLPPLLSLGLIRRAREQFVDPELRRVHQILAAAVLADAKDKGREIQLIIESLHTYVVRRSTLANHLSATEINDLLAAGFIRAAMHATDVPVLYVRLPELLASELAKQVANELIPLAKENVSQAVELLTHVAKHLPIGDVIAAQAVLDAVKRAGSLTLKLLHGLHEHRPKGLSVPVGIKFAAEHPSLGFVKIALREGGKMELEHQGKVHIMDYEEGDFGIVYDDPHPWLVLSHLAGHRPGLTGGDDNEPLTPGMLIELGTAEIPLRRPGNTVFSQRVLVHDMPGNGSLVCHVAGFLEQITYSIFEFLSRTGANADPWIDQVLERDSVYLLGRVHIALDAASDLDDVTVANWAITTLESKVSPAFQKHLQGVCSFEDEASN